MSKTIQEVFQCFEEQSVFQEFRERAKKSHREGVRKGKEIHDSLGKEHR